jgi:GTPase SAR1 family protein
MGCSSSKTVPSEGFNNLSLKHLQIKCVLLGDANVGKSSITGRYMRGHFSDVYDVTLGGVYNKK